MLKFDTLISGELLMIAGVVRSFVVLVTSLYEALFKLICFKLEFGP